MHLPDRGSRRQCNRDAKGNTECHKDEFRAHGVASHFHLHPADIGSRCGDSNPGRNTTNEQDRDSRRVIPPLCSASPGEAFWTELSIENASFKRKTPHSTLTGHEPNPRPAVHCAEPIQKFCEFDRNRQPRNLVIPLVPSLAGLRFRRPLSYCLIWHFYEASILKSAALIWTRAVWLGGIS